MKFLCLHGAIGNAENMGIQLGPLQKVLDTDKAASFLYIDGPCKIKPPQGFEDYFGVGPHYRWADDRGEAYNRMLDRTRELPSAPTPEDVIRILAGDERHEWHNQKQVLDLLYDALEDDQEIEGIIGYSEGASIAASFVLHEQWRGKETGRPRRVKCAAFFTGWPPIAPDGQGIVLCDESDLYIDIPTLHIVGANDPYKDGAMALYNVCDEDNAEMFDTGKGHIILRAGEGVAELGDAIRQLIAKSSS